MTNHLPAPRLQLRWRKSSNAELKRSIVGAYNEGKWTCDYEIVLPLGEHDGRRTKKKTEVVVRLGRTFMGNNGSVPTDAPFRDGAHASWDSEALGNIPVFVIGVDGVAFQKIKNADGFGYMLKAA